MSTDSESMRSDTRETPFCERDRDVFRAIVVGARDGFWYWNLETNEVYLSPRWKALLGFEDHELSDELETFYALLHPESREPFHTFLHQKMEGPDDSFETRFRLRHKDGGWRHVLAKGGIIRNEAGRPMTLAGSHTDITDLNRTEHLLKQSEARIRGLIGATREAIVALSPDGDVMIFNRAAEDLFGVSAEEMLGKRFSDLVSEQDRVRFESRFQEFMNSGAGRLELEGRGSLRCRSQDGQTVRVAGSLARSELASDPTAILVLRDLRNEEQSAQMQKLEAIGQLAAGVAHEINTPIQYVGDNLSFLKETVAAVSRLVQENREALADANGELPYDLDYLLEETPKALAQAEEGADRVATIVRALKEFSHPGNEEMTIANLRQNLESTITISRNEWKYHSEVVTDFDPSLSTICCYPGDLNQVFLNLLVNAAHAIAAAHPEGGGKIRVATRHAGEMAEVRISDNGGGIPYEIQKKVFEPFFTTKEPGKGTGQGLALAHRIVCERHGGELFFRTEPGQGTEFVVRIPLEPKREAAA